MVLVVKLQDVVNEMDGLKSGSVNGYIDDGLVKDQSSEKLEFTWKGSGENDEVFDSGWFKPLPSNRGLA